MLSLKILTNKIWFIEVYDFTTYDYKLYLFLVVNNNFLAFIKNSFLNFVYHLTYFDYNNLKVHMQLLILVPKFKIFLSFQIKPIKKTNFNIHMHVKVM